MFNIFKRSPAPAAKVATKPRAKPAPSKAASTPPVPRTAPQLLPAEPAKVPDAVEGNDHTDWALWEDSMTALDSQMQSLTPSARIYEKDKRVTSQFQDIETEDAFSSVRKKRDI
jgi:hypothetical protein